MTDTLTLVLAWMAGAMLGAMFYGGLWWTVRRGVASRRPALWFLGSQLVRMSLALTGMYIVSGGHFSRLLLCLLGFVMARLVVTSVARSPAEPHAHPAQEASHAP